MPILRRYSKAKLNDDQVKTMGGVLERYTEYVILLNLDYILYLMHYILCITAMWVLYYMLVLG